jgi:phenylacetate-CoA ligase
MLDAGRPLPPGRIKAAFTSSESLLAFQRSVIESAFSAPVRDHYSATELVASMTACHENRLHVDMEFCIVEVEVQEETEGWERGPLLATALGYDATPFIRYRIGDVGTRAKKPCPCGRPGDVFLDIDGRLDDYVVTPSGRLVGRLDHVFKEQWDLHEAQILQHAPDAVTVLIVPRSTYSEASQRKLLSEIHTHLGDDIRVDVRITDRIPREDNGKFRAVKSTLGDQLR